LRVHERLLRRWIRDDAILGPGECRHAMPRGVLKTDDVDDLDVPRYQVVSDDPAMTLPRHGLGAHDRHPLVSEKLIESVLELSRQRVISVGLERTVLPADVRHCLIRLAPAAEAREVEIGDTGLGKRPLHLLLIEVRPRSGARKAAP